MQEKDEFCSNCGEKVEKVSEPKTIKEESSSKEKSKAPMILGICSIVFSGFPILSIILAIIGLVLFKKSKKANPTLNTTAKVLNILGIVLSVISIIIISSIIIMYIVFPKNVSDNNDDDNYDVEEITNTDTKEWKTPDGTSNSIKFYSSGYYTNSVYQNEDDSFYTKEDSIYTLKATYKCTNYDCHAYSVINDFVAIRDGSQYLYYDLSSNKSRVIDITGTFNNISVMNYEDKIYGLVLSNSDGKQGFYSYDEERLTIDYIYSSINDYEQYMSILKDGYIIACNYAEGNDYGTYYVLDYKDGSVKFKSENASIKVISYENNTYYLKNYAINSTDAEIYDSNFKKVLDGRYYQIGISNSGNIAVANSGDKTFSIYNSKGTLIKTSKEYSEVSVIMNDYVAVIDTDNYLKLVDFDGNVVAKFLQMNSNYKLHTALSGWYTQQGKNGVYLVVENTDIAYGTIGSGLEYYYTPKTKEKGVIETEGIGGYAKPVLYLYPKEDNTSVTVTFAKSNLLTTTYPKYKDSWKVTANKNGDLHDASGKYYYALYWEEDGSSNVDFSTGFYVTKSNALDFLEEKLTTIGLNDKERNEFIMYWLPILEKNGKSLVYFELTEQRQTFNKIIINPTPDSLLRVAIHIKKVNKKTNIAEETLSTFERNGFTAVEWGGVIH